MKRSYSAAAAALTILACGGEKTPNNIPPAQGETITVDANLTADATWTKENIYVLDKHIFVESGTLRIEAGTKILGRPETSLVITQNAKIDAQGTAAAPIVFTSIKDEGARMAGDWGGVVVLGKARINPSGGKENIEGFAGMDAMTEYGGGDDAHDCGTLRYVRIEFAGFELSMDNELNGLTLAGCGSATEIDYVQVHKGADDGVEVFGGTVNLKHVVITQPDDDGLDWDFGWTGKAQFVFVQQNASVGNCAIEADNNKDMNDADPRSRPVIWNATFAGSDAAPGMAGKTQLGAHLRRGTGVSMHNAIFTHFADLAIDVDGASSVGQAANGGLSIEHSIFFDNGGADVPAEAMDNDQGFDERAFFTAMITTNRTLDPALTDMLNLEAPNAMPMAGSPAMEDAGTPPADGFFDTGAAWAGAFGVEDWTAGWAAYPAR